MIRVSKEKNCLKSLSAQYFLFKTLLFLAIGGVVWRVKTHNMYEMGGLIKRMPWSFIAVLIGIITLAGIPPLSGYAGKWLFYNAVITKGWYFQGAIVFFAGTIAFLYCFKLIYSVFYRNVGTVWFLHHAGCVYLVYGRSTWLEWCIQRSNLWFIPWVCIFYANCRRLYCRPFFRL